MAKQRVERRKPGDCGVRVPMNAADIIDTSPTVDILLVPDGAVESVNGNFTVDLESFNLTVKEFETHGTDVPIDYEHQTLGKQWSSPTGKAPAAGWIRAMRYEPGRGIIGQVAWTDEAKAEIRAGKYRYLSPVAIVRKSDGKMVALHSAALTNKPAILDMEKVAARDEGLFGDTTMDLKELRAALAAAGVTLDESADDTAVLTAAKVFVEASAKRSAEPPPLSAVAAKMGLDKSAGLDVIVAKVAELQTNVPAAEYKAVTTRLEALEASAKDREGQELVACAIETAKLNPNDQKQMDWARKFAKSNPVAFKDWSDAAPALYSAGRLTNPSAKLDASDDRSAMIAKASSEYDENPTQAMGARKESWVNTALTEAGMRKLDEKELKALAG